MQTILGSGGAIGIELAKALKSYTDDIRLVSRHPEKINTSDTLFPANLLDQEDVLKAVEGSSIVYITVGFPYSSKVWAESWPKFIADVIEACQISNAKLVFFDNVYMYDPESIGNMTEETTLKPRSLKGKTRHLISKMIMDATKSGKLTALIARSADFYGPNIKNTSMLTEVVFKPLSTGKKASWMSSVNFKHAFTFTPDAGAATALLGNTEDAYNQVWHLPTASNVMTGQEWIETIANQLGAKPRYQVASKFIVRIMGLFSPIMREMPEMMYQFDRDYIFKSDKFENRFKIEPTSYLDGIKTIIDSDYSSDKVS